MSYGRYRVRVYRKRSSFGSNYERLHYKMRFEDAEKKDANKQLRWEYRHFVPRKTKGSAS